VELTSGGVAGLVTWGLACPFDVVKTRLQSHLGAGAGVSGACAAEPQFWGTFWGIVRHEGWRGLYSGAAPLLCRAFCVNAVTFYAYEVRVQLRSRFDLTHLASSSWSWVGGVLIAVPWWECACAIC
jgi:hypothetical protein